MLDEIETLAERFEVADLEVGGRLRDRGRLLYERLTEHIDHEDAVLAPALRARGPSGRSSAERLAHEHCEQRELLKYLLGRLGEQRNPTLLIARELANFAEFVRLDMAQEEETMLTEEVLRDDIG